MGLTVIGVFNSSSKARQAVEALARIGLLRNNIVLSVQAGTPISKDILIPDQPINPTSLPSEKLVEDIELTGSHSGNFITSLLGYDQDETDRLTRIADFGSVITVHAQTDEEARQATDMLTAQGAVDVNERIGTYNLGHASKEPQS